ncbi:MAG: hypothetical protein A4E49_01680 [Methanosaeta sp. PtaU1.Bin112]|nr:MAG: hypothetical protein A4E49_01680 [Methanosaeta sp. PtaU1.Bin112]
MEYQIVIARGQVNEAVSAVCIGNCSCRQASIRPVQLNHHICQTRLARVLNAVAIQVHPYKVAYICRSIDAGIPGIVDFVRAQGDECSSASIDVGVAVNVVIAALVSAGEFVSRGKAELQPIISRSQVCKCIQSIGISCGLAYLGAVRQVKLHRHAGDARLTCILQSIAVCVIPDIISDRCGPIKSRIDCGIGLAGKQGD